jgi:hypothetical protein
VVGGEVVLDEGAAEVYLLDDPEKNERMAFELASLPFTGRVPSPSKLEKFVGEHGLLWHGREYLGTGRCRESLQDWATAVHVLTHAGVLYQKITDSKEAESISELRRFLRAYGHYFPDAGYDQDEYRLHATALLRTLMNAGLWGGTPAQTRTMWSLVMEGPGDLKLAYFAPDLLTTAYASFAHLMAGKYRLKTCAGCGALFRPVGRRDQKWCSKSCGSTARARRARRPA